VKERSLLAPHKKPGAKPRLSAEGPSAVADEASRNPIPFLAVLEERNRASQPRGRGCATLVPAPFGYSSGFWTLIAER